MISAEIGRVTGKGIAANMRRYYSPYLLYALVGLLVLANVINIGADLGAMGAALQLILPGPKWLYVPAFAILIVLLEVFMRYASYVSVLRWLTLSLFAYVATVFVVGDRQRSPSISSFCMSSGRRPISRWLSPSSARRSAPICFSGRLRRRSRTSGRTRRGADPRSAGSSAAGASAHPARHDGWHGPFQCDRTFHYADDRGDAPRARRDQRRNLGGRREGSKPIAGEAGLRGFRARHRRHGTARGAGSGRQRGLRSRRDARLADRAR